MKAIGRVVGTERKPNTPHEFHFWTAPDSEVGIGTLVKVVIDAPRLLTVYGIVVDGASYTDLQTALHDYIGLQADPAKLRQVLLYHVVASSVDLVAAGNELTSAEGSLLPIVRADSTVKVAGGTVNTTAIMGGGTSKVYVIDTVLLPPSLR